jgi:hypothetical protein
MTGGNGDTAILAPILANGPAGARREMTHSLASLQLRCIGAMP